MENKQAAKILAATSEKGKRAYTTPRLISYGKVTDQTLAITNKGPLDGGSVVGKRHS